MGSVGGMGVESLVQGAVLSCGCTLDSPGSFNTTPSKSGPGAMGGSIIVELARNVASVPTYQIRSASLQIPRDVPVY